MAYFPMTIGGKKYTETSLWTNPSPTSNFATQNINLSESMTNYKYLLVKWKTDTSTNQVGEIIVPVDNFKSQTVSPYYNYPAMETNSANYFRAFVYTSDTQIMMANCFKLNGGTTAYNQYNIPTEVLGLNELDTGKRFDETSLWTNPSPTSDFAGQTVSLSESIDNFKYIKIHYAQSSSATSKVYDAIYCVEDIKNSIIGGSAENNLISFSIENSSNVMMTRFIGYVSNTSLSITIANRANASGTGGGSAVPLEIVGLKFA